MCVFSRNVINGIPCASQTEGRDEKFVWNLRVPLTLWKGVAELEDSGG